MSVLGFTNPPIGQPLTSSALEDRFGALCIFDAQRRAVIPAEAKFVHVALEMGFADRVEATHDAALQDGEERFDGLGVRLAILAYVLAGAVIDADVLRELTTEIVIDQAVVGVQITLAARLGYENFADSL